MTNVCRLNAAAESSSQDKSVQELQQQVSDLKTEVNQWRSRLTEKEEEYKASERDMRKHVLDSEKKAHEIWVRYISPPSLPPSL